MTKYFRLLTCLMTLAFAAGSLLAQSPYQFSYQASVRNAAGQLHSFQTIGVQISILQGSSTGTVVYKETQTAKTNANGVYAIVVGGGESNAVAGSIETINWGTGTYFLQSDIDLDNDGTYDLTLTEQLVYVPYALYARHTSDRIKEVLENDNCADMMQIKCIAQPTEDYDVVTKIYIDSVMRELIEKLEEIAEEGGGDSGDDDCDVSISTKLIQYNGTYEGAAISKRGTTVTVDPNSTLKLSAEATGDGTITYEWSTSPFFETVLATTQDYTLTAGAEGSAIYYVRAKATEGNCSEKSTKSITVNFGDPPVDCSTMVEPILTGPKSICMGSTAKLSVANPQEDYTYEFFKDGTSIGEGTSKTVSEKGSYYVIAKWNKCDEKKSNTIELDKKMSMSTPSVSVVSASGTSATIKISSGGMIGTTAYFVVYDGDNNMVTGGSVYLSSTSKEVSLSKLSPNTEYTVLVQTEKEGYCESEIASTTLNTVYDCPTPQNITYRVNKHSDQDFSVEITAINPSTPSNYTVHWYISKNNGDGCGNKLFKNDGTVASYDWIDNIPSGSSEFQIYDIGTREVRFRASATPLDQMANNMWIRPSDRKNYGYIFNRTLKVVITSTNPGCVEGSKDSAVFCTGKINFYDGSIRSVSKSN